MAVFTALGWLIFLRKSDDRMALLVAIFLVIYGANSSSVAQFPVWSPIVTHIVDSITGLIAFVPAALFFYLFPTGRFVPRWTRWFVLAWVIFAGSYNIVDTLMAGPLGGAIAVTLWGSFLVAQVYRYLRVSTPVDRLRTKWVLYGAVAAIAGNLAQILLSPDVANGYGPLVLETPLKDGLGFTLPPLLQGMGGVLALSLVANVTFLMIPVTLTIAILRYRLFDIDVIINRTLVYGSLTTVLGGIYFGSIVILQALLRGITNTTSSVALVVSTLLIAVLFQPLRRLLQSAIDRRFYRGEIRCCPGCRPVQRYTLAESGTGRGDVEFAARGGTDDAPLTGVAVDTHSGAGGRELTATGQEIRSAQLPDTAL